MLGLYQNFPVNVHRIVQFTTSISKGKLQHILTHKLHELNKQKFSLRDVAHLSIPQCTVIFEFGIAKENSFIYLDEEETGKILGILGERFLQVLDFFCSIRYYKTEKKTPLKFDYYMLRFTLHEDLAEVQVYHERGPRHVSPEEIVNFIAEEINKAFSRKILRVSETF